MYVLIHILWRRITINHSKYSDFVAHISEYSKFLKLEKWDLLSNGVTNFGWGLTLSDMEITPVTIILRSTSFHISGTNLSDFCEFFCEYIVSCDNVYDH